MNSNQIEKDRSCALQVLEGHKPEEYRLSRFEQPAPLITANLHHETSPHDSASTEASSTSSVWSGIISQCGFAFSRTTSLTPSIKSHKRQHSASSLAYLQLQKPLPPLPPDEPSPSPTSNLQQQVSKLCLSPSKPQQIVLPDRHSPLISPALSNFTISSESSYASHLLDNPTDSFREDIRIFHPRSQNRYITTATIDTGSDCCCIRLDVLHSLGIQLSSPFVRPTTLSTKGISGSTWQPLGRIELTWLPFHRDNFGEVEEAHHTWFFIGDKGLPHPVLLGKDFLFPRESPPRVFAVLVNVLNTPSKKEKKEKMEAERRHRALVRDNEKAKEGRMAVMQTYGTRLETGSETSSEKSIVAERS
ncbi:hypothetical protein BKA61DRAFT_683135 [Leptodontidium sp. MPI-SDFR-AT-0119]|nr:hypothetical protein BKA61DRAFT_683135 [Leptodontidium sp. MPI-SDFR-AT-0119]